MGGEGNDMFSFVGEPREVMSSLVIKKNVCLCQ